jgi:hypothetical protein
VEFGLRSQAGNLKSGSFGRVFCAAHEMAWVIFLFRASAEKAITYHHRARIFYA